MMTSEPTGHCISEGLTGNPMFTLQLGTGQESSSSIRATRRRIVATRMTLYIACVSQKVDPDGDRENADGLNRSSSANEKPMHG